MRLNRWQVILLGALFGVVSSILFGPLPHLALAALALVYVWAVWR